MIEQNKNQGEGYGAGTSGAPVENFDTFMPEFSVAMNRDAKLLVSRVRHTNPSKLRLAQEWGNKLAANVREQLAHEITDAETRLLITLSGMESLALASFYQDAPCLEAGVTLASDGSIDVDESVDYLREEVNANLPRSFFDEQIGASNAGS
ncbi:MAG: hypothetical protein C0473_00955 [Cyanobacteria bacterium DS3.002]|nr:hypothetical protein [Cyanobacteria bacterium DS3.002]MBA4049516.1 hypothetical protein [Cyanobacteria bacterium DS2.008]MBA4076185.1 hypothetical protein [Cyanobacteria bacterium PR.023]